jgi:transcriptional regulator with XRE-family HTH domain
MAKQTTRPFYFHDVLGELLQRDPLTQEQRARRCGVALQTLLSARCGGNLRIGTLRRIEAGFADMGLQPGMLTGMTKPVLSVKLEVAA